MSLQEYKDWNPTLFPDWVKTSPLNEQPERVTDEMRLHWAILEMVGESGEVLELVQKSIRKMKSIDKDKLKDELSDVFWGLTAICNIAGFTYEEIAEYNKKKLEERYK